MGNTNVDWSQAPEWAQSWFVIGRRDEPQAKWYALWWSANRSERAPMFGFSGDPADSRGNRTVSA